MRSTVSAFDPVRIGGRIITEGTQPSVVGQGYPDTPGVHSAEQVEAWRRVTDAVHAEGSRWSRTAPQTYTDYPTLNRRETP
ncbi:MULTISPECIES: hypothetical protein [unclassified Kribbella]|uniref:oxidoreductase n=1 Tax=unclassified Kribbella TaxID=2644121 RepID=UPI0033F019A8